MATHIKAPVQTAVAEMAGAAWFRECVQRIPRERQWLAEQHLQLCRVASPTFFEAKRAEWMLQQLRALGCEAQIDRAGNVVARLNGTYNGPYLALTAHLDTVLAPRSPEEIFTTPDGRLNGPGVSDNGAGLAAVLAIAKLLERDRELFAPLLLVANVGEEGEGNLSGMRYLCRNSPLGSQIRSFLVLDGPAMDHITCQALASRRFDISFSGPGGHSWSDYGIANPAHALCRAVSLFSEQRVPAGPGARASYNFGILEAGASINSIPARARAKLDIRSECPERLDEFAAALTLCVERAMEIENERATGGRLSAKIKEIGSRPGGRLPEEAPVFQAIKAVDAWLGIRSHVDCASTDANIPLSMGVPAISIGAGGQGGGAHTAHEWFHPEGREIGLKRILLTLGLLAQGLQLQG